MLAKKMMSVVIIFSVMMWLCKDILAVEDIYSLRKPLNSPQELSQRFVYATEDYRHKVLDILKERIINLLESDVKLSTLEKFGIDKKDITILIHGSMVKKDRFKLYNPVHNKGSDIDLIGIIPIDPQMDMFKAMQCCDEIGKEIKKILEDSVQVNNQAHEINVSCFSRDSYIWGSEWNAETGFYTSEGFLGEPVRAESLYFASRTKNIYGNTEWMPFYKLKDEVIGHFESGKYFEVQKEGDFKDLKERIEQAKALSVKEDSLEKITAIHKMVDNIYTVTALFRVIFELHLNFPSSMESLETGLTSIFSDKGPSELLDLAYKSIGANNCPIISKKIILTK